MNEHPILFSGEMVRAILEGRKTQTRRVMNPQPVKDIGESPYYFYKRGSRVYSLPGQFRHFKSPKFTQEDDDMLLGIWGTCPYGKKGDQLWVRETWRETFDIDEISVMEYRAGGTRIIDGKTIRHGQHRITSVLPKWRPSIFMPRWASRIQLEVVSVRIERVQVISVRDACSEGIIPPDPGSPTRHYADLWDKINAKRGFSWDVNPWVWVIEFKTL